jgi:integrase
MSIYNISPAHWLVRVRTRQGGKVVCRKKKMTGTRQDARRVEFQLREELDRGIPIVLSQTRTFGEALAYYREHTEADLSHSKTYLDRLSRDLGVVLLPSLTERFAEYWRLLREERSKHTGKLLSPITRNHILTFGKAALNLCMKRGLIEKNPLACFQKLPTEARDRVLTDDERDKILSIMKRKNSFLYWPFYFSLRNPIRRGDLTRLSWDNLDWFRPWIHFYPSKTRKRKFRETCLPFIDEPLLEYFKTLPKGGLLFPRIDEKGIRHPLGDFKNHFHNILNEAEVRDFRWHDIKHCAITWVLDSGYPERDLKNLGIQYSSAMIDRYYHHDAEKVLVKWKAMTNKELVVPPCGTLAEKTVKFAQKTA